MDINGISEIQPEMNRYFSQIHEAPFFEAYVYVSLKDIFKNEW